MRRLPAAKRGLTAWLHGILGAAKGRPFAGALLLALIALNGWIEANPTQATKGLLMHETLHLLGQPFAIGQRLNFDLYQRLFPRIRASQPVTIVAIDEKSLKRIGQWPWPRNTLARLIDAVQQHEPAAIGLDIYMPEPDQTSPHLAAARIASSDPKLTNALAGLPSHDTVLAESLRDSPSVLGAAGFDFDSYTTSSSMRSVPLIQHGSGAQNWVRHYNTVLASLPELQAAAHGQALLSVDAKSDMVRQIPLLATVGTTLYPSAALEILRVATGSNAIEVNAASHGISHVQVADLAVPTQPNGQVWLHGATVDDGLRRYVSAADILDGRVEASSLTQKMVLIGLTGVGLNDMRKTPLGELAPGIEMHAQLIESFFDGRFLLRPWWFIWLELSVIAFLSMALIWFLPKADSPVASFLRFRPRYVVGAMLGIDVVILAIGTWLFVQFGLLLDAAAILSVFTLVVMALVTSSLVEDLGKTRTRLSRLVKNGILLGRERDRDKLLHQTLLSAREIANCERAVLFLRTESNTLTQVIATGVDAPAIDDIPLFQADGKANEKLAGPYAVLNGKTVVADDPWQASEFNLSESQQLSSLSGFHVRSTLNVPMQSSEGKVIGMIQLMNALTPNSHLPTRFDPRLFGFLDALAAQAAVAIENRNLLEAQKSLMDALIQILAGAIDTKSPYTGGHFERVPELAMLLAEEAAKVNTGELAAFGFKNEEEWREFRIGAWLHDCGKVTTPEYVVDKATKLEVIYNRIHEIRTRFEVLWRDADIEYLRALHERGEPQDVAEAHRTATRTRLQDDFAFVASSNVGAEYFSPDKVERLKAIASTSWLRHFDNRLGLSHDELDRHAHAPKAALPVAEPLLADKTHHLFTRPPNTALDPLHGFTPKVPEHLYNHGEVYNLSVSRGTLTEEERFKINEHIIQTIVMLEQMPLPPELRRVPEYAGTHHETLIGTGYPRQLTAAQLSIPSRIMAIADIFEALTASDRPYKKAKTLSESIDILATFKKNQHIDPNLFDLFLTSGVYLTYAQRFLLPSQIDTVDVNKYLTPK